MDITPPPPVPQQTNGRSRLLLIKTLHTIIWAFFVALIGYILYGGLTGNLTTYTWIASGLVIAEGLTLLLFRNRCPLTLLARNYSASAKDNFDIFLPNWLARNNKRLFTALYLLGMALIAYRLR